MNKVDEVKTHNDAGFLMGYEFYEDNGKFRWIFTEHGQPDDVSSARFDSLIDALRGASDDANDCFVSHEEAKNLMRMMRGKATRLEKKNQS